MLLGVVLVWCVLPWSVSSRSSCPGLRFENLWCLLRRFHSTSKFIHVKSRPSVWGRPALPRSVAATQPGVLSKLARARGGVRPHRGFTVKFTAPGAPHLGHHHLPPIPRCRHHAPGAYRPRLPTYVHRERLSCTLFSAHLDSPREKAERRRAHKRSRGLPPSR